MPANFGWICREKLLLTTVSLRLFAAVLILHASAGLAAALTQADLDKPLENFVADPRGDFVAVCRALRTGCGVEVVGGVESLNTRNAPLPRFGRTAREILDEYIAGRPHDSWSLDDGVLNLRPLNPPSPDLLSKKVSITGLHASADFLALQLLYRAGAIVTVQPYWANFKRMHPTIKNKSVRQGLNSITKADDDFIWIIAHPGPGQPGHLSFEAIQFHRRYSGILNDESVPPLKVMTRPVRE